MSDKPKKIEFGEMFGFQQKDGEYIHAVRFDPQMDEQPDKFREMQDDIAKADKQILKLKADLVSAQERAAHYFNLWNDLVDKTLEKGEPE